MSRDSFATSVHFISSSCIKRPSALMALSSSITQDESAHLNFAYSVSNVYGDLFVRGTMFPSPWGELYRRRQGMLE
jgi:hypothetical protein